ncbi:glycine cleavage system protein GcvH [Litchfieldella xinjiangensis]|uniref:glycine cleavage system protein GcvH n=1 Tax=Litchfieldella xinjiangensis TaxID=1166948 RepID=UPI0005BD585D|nr:glycine cleavage system protein GcvH [Halomonas xinjiangensis]
MSNLPANLRYTESHEWVLDNGDGTVTLGITDHAQQALGDVVFVELPDVGRTLESGGELGVIESVKAASDLYAPLAGEIVEANTALEDAPETVNESPYDKGWIAKLKPSNIEAINDLLDADAYAKVAEQDD